MGLGKEFEVRPAQMGIEMWPPFRCVIWSDELLILSEPWFPHLSRRDNVYTVKLLRQFLTLKSRFSLILFLWALKPVSKGRKSAPVSFWVPVPLEGLRPSQAIAEFPGEAEICETVNRNHETDVKNERLLCDNVSRW